MIKSRLNKIEKMLKPNLRNCHLIAIEIPDMPEKSKYTIWDSVPGSGGKDVTKEEWEVMAEKVSEVNAVKIVRGKVVKIIDDIPDEGGELNAVGQ